MSRIIKFRAWDKKNKRMLYDMPWLIRDKEREVYVVGSLDPPNPFDLTGTEQEYKVDWYLDGGIYPYPAILMQFIGMKDKHGRDVYEDDIIKAEWHWDEPHQIVWPDDYYHFAEYGLGFDGEHIEVIGNVHENPELLCSTD